MKPRYTEHALLPPLPEVIEICRRCQRGLVYRLNTGEAPTPWCYACGNDEPGIRYRRIPTEAGEPDP